MFLAFSLILCILASAQTFEFEHIDHVHNFCKDSEQNSLNSFFCEPFFEFFKSILRPFPGNQDCEVCETVVRELKKEGDIKRVVENFIDSISSRFCETLGSEMKDKCNLWMPSHSNDIKLWSVKQIQEGTLCQNLLKCPSKEKMSDSIKKFEIVKDDYRLCGVCIDSVKKVEQMFLNGLSYNLMFQVIDELICKAPENIYNTNCDKLVHRLVDKVMKVVSKFQNASQLCTEMELCESTLVGDFYSSFEYYSEIQRVTPDSLCDICHNISTTRLSELRGGVDIHHWKSVGYIFLCDDATDKDSCKKLVDIVMTFIAEETKLSLTKEVMCDKILECPKTKSSEFFHFFDFLKKEAKGSEEKPKRKNISCFTCEVISKMLRYTMEQPDTRMLAEQVYAAIVCRENKYDGVQCGEAIQRDVPSILEHISTRLGNYSLCTRICKYKREEIVFIETKNGKPCIFCKKVINNLKESIGFHYRNEKIVESKMKHACQHLPIIEKKNCLRVMSEHRHEIKRRLMKDEKAKHICEKIYVCPKEDVFQKFLSGFHHKESYPFDYFHKEESHPYKFFDFFKSYADKFFDYKKSYPFDFYHKEESHPYKFFDFFKSYADKFFDYKKSYPFDFYHKEESHPYKFFDFFKSYPFKFFDYKKSYPFDFYHKEESHPYKFFDFFKSYPFKFFDYKKSYPFDFYHKEESHPYKFFDFFKSYPFKFFDYKKSYPFDFYHKEESHPYFDSKFFKEFYGQFEKKDLVNSDCEICSKYVEELKELYKAYSTDPRFWRVFVDDMCKIVDSKMPNCRSDVEKYFEKTFKVFEDGKSLEDVCKKSCEKFKNSIFPCLVEPTKFCEGNVKEHCGMYGELFCNMKF